MTKKNTESVEFLVRPSRSEWELLRIISKLGQPTMEEILKEALERNRVLDYFSSHKLLKRLLEKGYLDSAKDSARFVHYALRVDAVAILRLEVERFVEEVVGSERSRLEVVRQILEERLGSLRG